MILPDNIEVRKEPVFLYKNPFNKVDVSGYLLSVKKNIAL